MHSFFILKVEALKNIEILNGLNKLKSNRSLVPSITCVDFSARIQTVDKNVNKKFYDLIKEFFKLSGCPMLINTSFNVWGEPIVNTPSDAFRCFMGTELHVLVCNNFILYKNEQNIWCKNFIKNVKNFFLQFWYSFLFI